MATFMLNPIKSKAFTLHQNYDTWILPTPASWGGMGYLSILFWIKVHYVLNPFTGLEFSNFTIYNPKNSF